MSIKYSTISASSSGDNTVVAGIANKKIVVLNYTVIATSDVNLTFKSASTAITGAMPIVANGGSGGVNATGGSANQFVTIGLFECGVGESLVLNLSGAVACAGHLAYNLISV